MRRSQNLEERGLDCKLYSKYEPIGSSMSRYQCDQTIELKDCLNTELKTLTSENKVNTEEIRPHCKCDHCTSKGKTKIKGLFNLKTTNLLNKFKLNEKLSSHISQVNDSKRKMENFNSFKDKTKIELWKEYNKFKKEVHGMRSLATSPDMEVFCTPQDMVERNISNRNQIKKLGDHSNNCCFYSHIQSSEDRIIFAKNKSKNSELRNINNINGVENYKLFDKKHIHKNYVGHIIGIDFPHLHSLSKNEYRSSNKYEQGYVDKNYEKKISTKRNNTEILDDYKDYEYIKKLKDQKAKEQQELLDSYKKRNNNSMNNNNNFYQHNENGLPVISETSSNYSNPNYSVKNKKYNFSPSRPSKDVSVERDLLTANKSILQSQVEFSSSRVQNNSRMSTEFRSHMKTENTVKSSTCDYDLNGHESFDDLNYDHCERDCDLLDYQNSDYSSSYINDTLTKSSASASSNPTNKNKNKYQLKDEFKQYVNVDSFNKIIEEFVTSYKETTNFRKYSTIKLNPNFLKLGSIGKSNEKDKNYNFNKYVDKTDKYKIKYQYPNLQNQSNSDLYKTADKIKMNMEDAKYSDLRAEARKVDTYLKEELLQDNISSKGMNLFDLIQINAEEVNNLMVLPTLLECYTKHNETAKEKESLQENTKELKELEIKLLQNQHNSILQHDVTYNMVNSLNAIYGQFESFISSLLLVKKDYVKKSKDTKFHKTEDQNDSSLQDRKIGGYNKNQYLQLYKKTFKRKNKLFDEIINVYKQKATLRIKFLKLMEFLHNNRNYQYFLSVSEVLSQAQRNKTGYNLHALGRLLNKHRFKHYFRLNEYISKYNKILDKIIDMELTPECFYFLDALKSIIESDKSITTPNIVSILMSIDAFSSVFQTILKEVLVTFELNVITVYYAMKSWGHHLDEDLFEIKYISKTRNVIWKLINERNLDKEINEDDDYDFDDDNHSIYQDVSADKKEEIERNNYNKQIIRKGSFMFDSPNTKYKY